MASNPKRPPPPSRQATSNKSGAQSHRSSRRPAASTNPSDDRGAAVSETASQDTHQVATEQEGQAATNKPTKRKKNRNRRRRNRRQSFLAPEDSQLEAATAPAPDATTVSNLAADRPKPEAAGRFYKLGSALSSTSLESEALLDHRSQPVMRPRRASRLTQTFRQSSLSNALRPDDVQSGARTQGKEDDSDNASAVDDRTPLMQPSSEHASNRTQYGADGKSGPLGFRRPRPSGQVNSPRHSPRDTTTSPADRDYDVNNPPSMPGTPKLGPEMNYDDAVVTGAEFDFSLARSIENRMDPGSDPHDMVIDMEDTGDKPDLRTAEGLRRRQTVTLPVEEDVCFPREVASELAEEDQRPSRETTGDRRRRRHKQWPDLSVLEDWSHEQKEEESGGDFRAKKISEPMLIEGRLRPQYQTWRREEDEIPYRFTYFNEEFQSTIHAQTITELVQLGGSFRELFIPDPPELDESSDDESVGSEHPAGEHAASNGNYNAGGSANGAAPAAHSNGNNNNNSTNGSHGGHSGWNRPLAQRRTHSIISEAMSDARTSADISPSRGQQPSKPKRYGPRPAFWLDVLCPTDAEMRVLAKAFGIHALTAEDIMMQEAREKVELFRHYYFINYRTFEQDPNSENYLQPVNMYVVVFREGVLSFHFSQTPHPANVRRRIRQLMDYLLLSSDWISYALIDDITDVFGPLIQAIEDEVDEIDETIMRMHSSERPNGSSEAASVRPSDMLRRVGECRKKVMGMYRLLSNKADVVKGFAKRCNEHWEVAPKSEIGLYLGDIQDHIMTMTSSLTYYETLLSRAHSNYLAQINMIMNERQEQTADVLGKLTVLGTIVLPMNIICGMWGMNVKVPGQDVDNLYWFWSITFGLVLFALLAIYIAKRVYKLV